jgi:hypothetical protein
MTSFIPRSSCNQCYARSGGVMAWDGLGCRPRNRIQPLTLTPESSWWMEDDLCPTNWTELAPGSSRTLEPGSPKHRCKGGQSPQTHPPKCTPSGPKQTHCEHRLQHRPSSLSTGRNKRGSSTAPVYVASDSDRAHSEVLYLFPMQGLPDALPACCSAA